MEGNSQAVRFCHVSQPSPFLHSGPVQEHTLFIAVSHGVLQSGKSFGHSLLVKCLTLLEFRAPIPSVCVCLELPCDDSSFMGSWPMGRRSWLSQCLSCPLMLFIIDLHPDCLVLCCLPNIPTPSSPLLFFMFSNISSPSSQVSCSVSYPGGPK